MPQVKPLPGDYGPTNMTSGLQENLDWLKRHFSFPLSSGLVIRKFAVGRSSTEGAVIYLEGQVDWQHLNRTVLDPLIANNKPDDAPLDAHTLMDQCFKFSRLSFHLHERRP
jgi:spore germination protein KA